MNPKKLSIGSHVLYKGREVELSGEDFIQLESDISAGIIKGIVLTPEWVERVGLKKYRVKNEFIYYLIGGSFMVEYKQGVVVLNHGKTKIVYVHELEYLVLGLDLGN